jgi:uncharacterized membrane protein required for colicin V production
VTYIIFDLVIGVILLLFALRGRKRGLVLTLCSLAAVIIAFIGATAVADALTPKAADILAPKIASFIEQRLLDKDVSGEAASSGDDISAVDGNVTVETDDNSSEDSTGADRAESGGTDTSGSGTDTTKNAMGALGLPDGTFSSLKDALDDLKNIERLPSVLSAAIARSAAETVLYLLIFLIAFILILLLWRVAAHALDLVARLPVLHFFNKTGGFVLGLLKGALFLFVLAWVLRYLGNVIPDDTVEHTYLLRFFMTTDPLTFINGG